MTPNEVLDQLNELTAKVKDLIAGESFDDGEGTTEYVADTGEGDCSLMAGKGYNSHVDVLSTVSDTGNGFIFHFPSHSSTEQDNYVCVDYAEADYIRKLLTYLHKRDAA